MVSMTPAEAVALADQAITETELAMLGTEDPAELERLKGERADLTRIRALAERREAAERRERERAQRPTPEQLWREWQDVKFLKRSRLTAEMKAALIGKFGAENYRKLPW
jgi:hypothetical protein